MPVRTSKAYGDEGDVVAGAADDAELRKQRFGEPLWARPARPPRARPGIGGRFPGGSTVA
ncbi:hypothetical protein [Streptomyces sp. NPDC056682]|uniref:hypothetical protein n=1 Tax=Streptomyces sp. NPDC056682 TaxID=3345909 RepID=UPI0036B9B8E5